MPTDAEIENVSCSTVINCSIAPMIRSAIPRARPMSQSRAMTTNSSPPSRPTKSPERVQLEQPGADALQHSVADVVTARVVDVLEPVQIEQQDRCARRPPGDRIERLDEPGPVREPGERVVLGPEAEVHLRAVVLERERDDAGDGVEQRSVGGMEGVALDVVYRDQTPMHPGRTEPPGHRRCEAHGGHQPTRHEPGVGVLVHEHDLVATEDVRRLRVRERSRRRCRRSPAATRARSRAGGGLGRACPRTSRSGLPCAGAAGRARTRSSTRRRCSTQPDASSDARPASRSIQSVSSRSSDRAFKQHPVSSGCASVPSAMQRTVPDMCVHARSVACTEDRRSVTPRHARRRRA